MKYYIVSCNNFTINGLYNKVYNKVYNKALLAYRIVIIWLNQLLDQVTD